MATVWPNHISPPDSSTRALAASALQPEGIGSDSVVHTIHERLNAMQAGLDAVQNQMQEQKASIVGAITAAQDAVVARIASLLSPPA